MANLNKVFLMGNLTRDPELRYIPSGQAVTTLGLAVNNKFGKGEDAKEDVLFIDVTVWAKTAENCAEYLGKGSPVFVEGRLKLETWDDKETGQKRSKVSVTANSVQFLSGGPRSGGGKGSQNSGADDSSQPVDDDEVPF
jgi:single-strand DNA-binding protein